MRQKSLLILLTTALLSAGLSACGTKNNFNFVNRFLESDGDGIILVSLLSAVGNIGYNICVGIIGSILGGCRGYRGKNQRRSGRIL